MVTECRDIDYIRLVCYQITVHKIHTYFSDTSLSIYLLFSSSYFFHVYIFLSRIAVNSIEHLQNIYRFVRSQNLKIQVTITIPFLIQYTFLRVSTSLSESKSTGVSRFDKDFRKNIEKAFNISLQTSALHKQYKHLDL